MNEDLIRCINCAKIDGEKLKNYIKSEINPYGKPFEGTVYDFGLKLMNYIDAMEKHTLATIDDVLK